MQKVSAAPVFLGQRVSKTIGTIYGPAATDGFVNACEQGAQYAHLIGYAGTNANPVLDGVKDRNYVVGTAVLVYANVMFPVLKGEYYLVVTSSITPAEQIMYFTPLNR